MSTVLSSIKGQIYVRALLHLTSVHLFSVLRAAYSLRCIVWVIGEWHRLKLNWPGSFRVDMHTTGLIHCSKQAIWLWYIKMDMSYDVSPGTHQNQWSVEYEWKGGKFLNPRKYYTNLLHSSYRRFAKLLTTTQSLVAVLWDGNKHKVTLHAITFLLIQETQFIFNFI